MANPNESPNRNTPEALELYRATEHNLLGSLLIAGCDGNTDVIEKVKVIVSLRDFLPNYLMGLHQRIFAAMLECKHTDPITVAQHMQQAGTLQPKDISYMMLMSADALGIDCEYYAKQVADNARRWRTNHTAIIHFKGGV